MELYLSDSKKQSIAKYCKDKNIIELSLFGSATTPMFTEKSDIDILIAFKSDTKLSLFDFIDIEEDLSEILNRRVDLVTRESIENSPNEILKKSILESAVKIYESK